MGLKEREQGWRSGLGSILDAITHVESACRFSALIPEVSLRVLRFSPFKKNQYLILFVATEFDLFRKKLKYFSLPVNELIVDMSE